MRSNRMAYPALAISVLLGLAACGGGDRPEVSLGADDTRVPVPPYYGLYAFDHGELVRLDGSAAWERQTWNDRDDLSPQTNFVIFSRAVMTDSSGLSDMIQLRRVAHLRSDVSADGRVVPQQDRWDTPDLASYQVPLSYRPVAGRPDMVVAEPAQPLSPGLYALHLNGRSQDVTSRIGIRWPEVQQAQYMAANCVDRYPTGYKTCAEADANPPQSSGQVSVVPLGQTTSELSAPAGNSVVAVPAAPVAGSNMVVRGLTSTKGSIAGGPTLVIEGDVINQSSTASMMPPLYANILDAQGTVLQKVAIEGIPPMTLAPGNSYHFRSEVLNPPPAAVRVRVTPGA